MSDLFRKMSLTIRSYYQARKFISRSSDPEQIRLIQDRKLSRLVEHCYKNVKYYRELFERHNLTPSDIKNREDLVKIPILTKHEVREQWWDFLCRELGPCRVSRTSGSTGVPVCILSDVNSRINNSAAVIRYRRELGIGLMNKAIISPQKNRFEPKKKSHWTFVQGVHKTYYVNPYLLDADVGGMVDKKIWKLRRPALIGITPALRVLAWQIRDGAIDKIRPCAVITTGEVLDVKTRELLEDTFGVRVTDVYACNEAGDVAWQCKLGEFYHINSDNCIVEIVKDGRYAKEGEVGEVVITNLNRYSMPFLRYKNGDLAKGFNGGCRCGCNLEMISEIIGRSGEDIFLPGNRTVAWNHLKGLMNHPGVRQFQIVQNKCGSLKIRIVAETGSDIESMKKSLLSNFKRILGNLVKIEFEMVNAIEPALSGKSKIVISHYRNG